MRLLHVALLSPLALAACGGPENTGPDAGTDAGAQTRTEKISALTGSVTAGQSSYANRGCAGCHGATGTGSGSFPDLHGPLKNDPKAEVLDVLLNGVPNTSMASYAGLEDQELADLYAYMKSEFGK